MTWICNYVASQSFASCTPILCFCFIFLLTESLLDQTLVSLLWAVSWLDLNLGPLPFFGMCTPILTRILLCQFNKNLSLLISNFPRYLNRLFILHSQIIYHPGLPSERILISHFSKNLPTLDFPLVISSLTCQHTTPASLHRYCNSF